MDHSRSQNADERIYLLTTYVAAPGTPIIDPNSGQRSESLPGHMYYMVSDGEGKFGYGFAPVGHGSPIGRGRVSLDDFQRYQGPVYARTIEISREQYDKLKEFGDAGRDGRSTYFNLGYNGLDNSCIDFTWGALNHAGLHRQLPFPNGQSAPLRGYDGEVLPEGNIAALRSVAAPFPDSPYNRVETHASPPGWVEKADRARDGAIEGLRDKAQEAIDGVKCTVFPDLRSCPGAGAHLDAAPAVRDPRDPASRDHALYKQIEAAVAQVDAHNGRSFDQLSERLTMCAFVDTKDARIASADHVALNVAGTKPRDDGVYVAANTSLCVVEGQDPYHPAARRAMTGVAQAVEQPVEHWLQRSQDVQQRQVQELAQQQNLAQGGPTQGGPTQSGPSIGPRTM